MPRPAIDLSVYLVTDSTPAVLGNHDLCQVVEAALRGGVTCVQYRDKNISTEGAVAAAEALHRVTRRFGVPLLINDRLDVAARVACEGVHIGQDDADFHDARRLLGQDMVIGVTASSKVEAVRAAEAGADYLGIGTVFATPTKKDAKSIIGPGGVSEILAALAAAGHGSVPAVCIGGITASNAAAVMAHAATPSKSLDGVAVVSAIMAADDPAAAGRALSARVLTAKIPRVLEAVARMTPLSHNMTNLVVQNLAANVALAVGASPIMSNYAEEAHDLAKLGGALVINMGTVTPDGLRNYVQALQAYNQARRPVVLDPVGAGATEVRRKAVKELLSAGHFAIIKGNEGEVQTVFGASTPQQRGVDSTTSLSVLDKAELAYAVARRESCVVLITGATDVLSDGRRAVRVDNGHEMLGAITGTGCTLGTTISAMVAVCPGDMLLAAVAGTVMFGVAAEMAAVRPEVRGPGTFVPAFIDELCTIRKATEGGDLRWLAMAKVTVVEVRAGGVGDPCLSNRG